MKDVYYESFPSVYAGLYKDVNYEINPFITSGIVLKLYEKRNNKEHYRY